MTDSISCDKPYVKFFKERILKMNHSALQQKLTQGFPGSTVLKNPPANSGDTRDLGLIPGLENSPGEGNGNLFQYSCLENSMDRRAWWATDHGVVKSQTKLGNLAHTEL